MSLASSAARGGAITLASQLLKVVLMLASTIMLARLLSPHDYGLVAMVVAVVGVGEIFRDFGLSMAALQAKDLTQQQQSNLFWINTGVGALLAMFFFGLSFLLGLFYGEPEVVGITQALTVTFLLGGLSTQFKVSINRELRFFALAIVDLVPYVLAFLAAVGLAIAYQTYWALVAQQIVVAVVTLVLAIALSRWRPGLPRKTPMRGLLSFGASFAATQLVSYATRNVDSIAIGRVWGSTSLGYYDRAYNLLLLPLTQINTPMSRVAVPVLARIAEEREKYVAFVRRAQLVALYVTATLFCLLAGMSTPLVVFVLGEKWTFTGQLLGVLAIGGVFRAIVQIAYWIYMSLGLATAQLKFYLIAQPALVVVILLGLPWGPMGVAITHSIGYALFWVASLLWVGKVTKLDLRPLFIDAARAIGLFGAPAAVLAYVSSGLLVEFGAPLQVVGGVVASVLWYAVAWLLFRRVRTDIGHLIDFARLAVQKRRKP